MASQWTAAKLYDAEHPQLNMDDILEEEEFLVCWNQIADFDIEARREGPANREKPFWEKCQVVVKKMFCTLTIEGRTGNQSYVSNDHKAHVEVNPAKHRSMNIKFVKHTTDNQFVKKFVKHNTDNCGRGVHFVEKTKLTQCLYHCHFHSGSKHLPSSQAKLIAIPTGKRSHDGETVYITM